MVVIAYDIPDDRRRTKLATFLEGYGRRVQYSVFECFISLDEMRQLFSKLQAKVNPLEDQVRLYWIAEDAVSRVLSIGGLPPEPPPAYYIV
jgi:CRISPR-associated protein Cas2